MSILYALAGFVTKCLPAGALRRTTIVAGLLALLPHSGPAQNAPRPPDVRPPAVAWAQNRLLAQRTQLGLTEQDLADPLVTDAYTDAYNGVSHVYLRQRYQGLEVLGAEMGLHFDRQGQLIQQSGTFVPRLAAAVGGVGTAPTLTAIAATGTAARALGLTPQRLRPALAARPGTPTIPNLIMLRDEALSQIPIPVRLVLVRQPEDGGRRVRLAWDLELAPPGQAHRWRSQIDAATGQVLSQTDQIIHEPARPATGGGAAPATSRNTAAHTANTATADGATYNVFAFPVEAPGFGPRTLLTNPADPLASPFGWHDTNGQPGPEYTITRGNNVYAFAGTTSRPGYSPDGTAALRFDFPYDLSNSPLTNRDAGITNLFYLNNALHDITFQYGFNEVSGNFQITNYTGKGIGHDPVLAVAQDADGVDNAYFSPGADGDSSSMHMFLWPQPFRLQFMVTAPASIAGTYPALESALGVVFPASPLSGKLVLATDGSATPGAACAPGGLTNAAAIKDNIALIDRGSCNFTVKILAAQKAGAVAVVIINNVAGAPIVIGGAPNGITIPSLMISLADGNRIKAALAASNPVTVAVQRMPPLLADRDGSFDDLIVAHEYTHGISTRLTGGPSRNDCLPTSNGKKLTDADYIPYETMGEGWSDFFALWFTTKPTDTSTTPRSVGTYVLAEATTGFGIRNKPYSTDFSVNDETYALIGKTYTETHDVGEVWAAILWDLNWAMINKYGYDADLYHGKGGNNKTMQLVMDGLKLQPCEPGFVTGRDAILAADKADFNGANRAIIWRTFARRGVGYDAKQGTVSALDNTASTTLPAGLDPLAAPGVEVYPNPAQEEVNVRGYAQGVDGKADVVLDVVSVVGQIVASYHIAAEDLRLGFPLNVRNLTNGVYLLRFQTPTGTIPTRRLLVNH